MGRETNISWTNSTWNCLRGCSRVSEGCRNCYAESIAHRFSGPGLAYEGLVQLNAEGKSTGKWNGKIKFVEEHLLDPLKWKKPRRIFVNSMSDLFHENVTDEMRDKIFAVMALCPQHTFQVLTKRPERMRDYLLADDAPLRWADAPADFNYESKADDQRVYNAMCARDNAKLDSKGTVHLDNPLPNVHLGVSVEDQKAADLRIPLLLQTPAAVRFLSAEPLLGSVSLKRIRMPEVLFGWHDVDVLTGDIWRSAQRIGFGAPRLDWVIVGGESGHGARPMHPDWARDLRDDCIAAGVPFFFKQWGEWIPWQPDGGFSEWRSQAGKLMDRHGFPDFKDADERGWTDDCFHEGDEICVHQHIGTKAAGCLLDGVEHHEFPAVLA